MTGPLWVSSTATEQRTLVADDLAADSGRYVRDSTSIAPGKCRFGIRLADGDPWADLVPSDWLEVLAADGPSPSSSRDGNVCRCGRGRRLG